ncbi:hypothetical protein DL96DRAFT_1588476 [Flagelloscypha sp. PMI_526]|nr:hypothetical protein DL96DRAFT_1588476 [Flagelloscypha sp. PMI_526]
MTSPKVRDSLELPELQVIEEWVNLPEHTPGKFDQVNNPLMASESSSHFSNIDVSSTFHLANHLPFTPDLAILSHDRVYFYVSKKHLISSSSNHFGGLLEIPSPSSNIHTHQVTVEDSAQVLNVILHAVFNISCDVYHPTFEVIQHALRCMPAYGLDPATYLLPSFPLYPLLISCAATNPIHVYALAAQHGAVELAFHASSHLLSYELDTISDELAVQMGPLYLKKLFFMHIRRKEALKNILRITPHTHADLEGCTAKARHQLTNEWASAAMALDLRQDLPVHVIKGRLQIVAEKLDCKECIENVSKRVEEVGVAWSQIKCTI